MSAPPPDYIEGFWDAQQVFDRLTWRMPGWRWKLLNRGASWGPYDDVQLVLVADTVDTYSESERPIRVTHHQMLRLPCPLDHFMDQVRRACHGALNHESDEWLKFDGQMLFDPHRDD